MRFTLSINRSLIVQKNNGYLKAYIVVHYMKALENLKEPFVVIGIILDVMISVHISSIVTEFLSSRMFIVISTHKETM